METETLNKETNNPTNEDDITEKEDEYYQKYSLHVTHIPLDNIKGKLYRAPLPSYFKKKAIPQILEIGIRNVVLLLVDEQLKKIYESGGIKVIYLPIRDGGCPNLHKARDTVSQTKKLLIEGENVLIHCYGGMGRTGLVMAIVVGELLNMKAEEAIKYLRQYYYAVETSEQWHFVELALNAPKYNKDFTHIPMPGIKGNLYRSPMPDTLEAIQHMKDKGISAVMVLCSTYECHFCTGFDLKTEYKKAGLQVLSFSIRESLFIPGSYEFPLISGYCLYDKKTLKPSPHFSIEIEARKQIDQAKEILLRGESLLIHCYDGLNRTGAIMACLIGELSREATDQLPCNLWHKNMDSRDSISYLRQHFDALNGINDMSYYGRNMTLFIQRFLGEDYRFPPRVFTDLVFASDKHELKTYVLPCHDEEHKKYHLIQREHYDQLYARMKANNYELF